MGMEDPVKWEMNISDLCLRCVRHIHFAIIGRGGRVGSCMFNFFLSYVSKIIINIFRFFVKHGEVVLLGYDV